jgi:hypothetical protein
MTSASHTATPVRFEFDAHGNLRPFTADQCVAVFTEWAGRYPTARFLVIAIEPDGSDAEALGWGLALPDHVFAYLPEINFTGRFRTAGELAKLLGVSMDARLIWVDPEPEYWPDELED